MDIDAFWDMTWTEYEYKVQAYRTKIARQWEPFRELQTFMHNMFAEKDKKLTPQQMYALITDVTTVNNTVEAGESDEEFFNRMLANNYYQPTTKE